MSCNKTNEQYKQIIEECLTLYKKKQKDYGTAWRILRTSSLTDQIFIKANRIRSIQISGVQKINEDIRGELIGIINYSVMALIQLELPENTTLELDEKTSEELYVKYSTNAFTLMVDKNHDYGEAWREMRVSSMVDIILMKILRIKQIEDNQGKTLVSEGLDANYYDIINYAIFALIKDLE